MAATQTRDQKRALARAEEVLPDRQRFTLDAAKWVTFEAALNAPTRKLPCLKKLLQEPSVFERGMKE